MKKASKYVVIVEHAGVHQHHTDRKPRIDKNGWAHILDTEGNRFIYRNAPMRLFIR